MASRRWQRATVLVGTPTMTELSNDARAIVDAIQDLTRVTLAVSGSFASRSDAIRRLSELSVLPSRIAAILAMPQGDVHSALAKAKKRLQMDKPEVTPTRQPKRMTSVPQSPSTSTGGETHGEE